MKRLFIVTAVVLVALTAGFVTGWVGSNDSHRTTVDAYPRPLAPLPVPEVRFPGDELAPREGVTPVEPPAVELCEAARRGPMPRSIDVCLTTTPRS